MRKDPLRCVELGKVLLEASSPLRHDLRNRLGSIRNMAYFVGRRVRDSEAAQRDPRVMEFLTSIEAEVEKANQLLDAWGERIGRVHQRRVQRVSGRQVVELAVNAAGLDTGIALEVSCEDGELDVDPLEAALAVRCLLENAGEAAGTGCVQLTAAPRGDEYRVLIRDRGPGFELALALDPEARHSPRAGHLGLGLAIARRTVDAAGGKLLVGRAPGAGTEAVLLLPLARRSEEDSARI
jgi:signal transduction histidine kinase